MGQKSIIVNTPNKKNHSDAQDWAAIFNGLYGGSTGILPIGSKLVVGVNEEFVIINDGVFSLSGHMLRVKEGTQQFLKLPETEVGKKRIAYVVAQYIMNTKLEDDTLEFAILAGEPDAINPLPPQVTIGNIDKGDRLNQAIIAELLIDGKKAEVNRYGKKANLLPNIQPSEDVSKLKKNFVMIDDFPRFNTDKSDSERLERAISFVTEKYNGGTIFLGYNNLTIDKTIGIKHNITLKGENGNATKITVVKDIPFVKNEDSKRKDYFNLESFALRRSVAGTTPLIYLNSVSYSRLQDLYIISFEGGQSVGNIGLKLIDSSHYNVIDNCQITQFNQGIVMENQANGNTVLAGCCLSCVKDGVLLDNTDSNKFISHSVELVAENAYRVVNSSYYNNFVSCRVENSQYSYVIKFDKDKPSFGNMVISGLDYSKKKGIVEGSNPVWDANTQSRLENQYYIPSLLITSTPPNDTPVSNTGSKIIFNRELEGRAVSYDKVSGVLTIDKTGSYSVDASFYLSVAQDSCDFSVIVNGQKREYSCLAGGKKVTCGVVNYFEKGDKVTFELKPKTSCVAYSGYTNTYISVHKN